MLYRRIAQTPLPTCVSLIVNTHTFSHFLLTLWASGLSNLIAQVDDTVTNLQIQQHQIHHLRPRIVISNWWESKRTLFHKKLHPVLEREESVTLHLERVVIFHIQLHGEVRTLYTVHAFHTLLHETGLCFETYFTWYLIYLLLLFCCC